MNDLAHQERSIFENCIPDVRLRYKAGCTFPFDVRWFQLAVQLIRREKRGDGEKIRCLWINNGRRPKQSSRIAGLVALMTYEKSDENMMNWMGKGGEKLHKNWSTSLYRIRPGTVRKGAVTYDGFVNHHPAFAVYYYWTALHQMVSSHPLPSMAAHSPQSRKLDVFFPLLRESTLKVLHP